MRTSKIGLALSIAICALFMMTAPAPATAQIAVGVSVTVAPPDLPVYDQPPCPGDDYIWTPGYWAWDADFDDYYWVPGTWVAAPEPGFFWTPGYWAWGGSGFVFTAGYWGPVVGFYGGIDYGFGYFGDGYVGGRWDHNHFFYNTAVNNVNVTRIHNTYRTEVSHREATRVSYNGGNGGITARATPQQEAAARERHVGPVAAQTRQVDEARGNKEFRASVNHGKPAIAATARAGDFKSNVVAAREAGEVHANNHAAANRGAENRPENKAGVHSESNSPAENNGARNNARIVHPNDIPPAEHPAAPNTGNAKLDQKYQQQQEKLAQKQEMENQKLQQRQDQEHQQAQKQAANEAKQQQMEQRHAQQTQALMQKHEQQNQRMQQHQQPAAHANEHPAPHGEAAAPQRKQ